MDKITSLIRGILYNLAISDSRWKGFNFDKKYNDKQRLEIKKYLNKKE